jgi:hypothetical protein
MIELVLVLLILLAPAIRRSPILCLVVCLVALYVSIASFVDWGARKYPGTAWTDVQHTMIRRQRAVLAPLKEVTPPLPAADDTYDAASRRWERTMRGAR